jgi:uncharacterized alkaline shock family protein YloU
MVADALGVVRVARQVLLTIVINTALQVPGVVAIAGGSERWPRMAGRPSPQQGVALSIKEGSVAADLYLVVAQDVSVVDVGSAVQQEVAAAIEHMVGMRVREVNVYIQDVA